MLYLISLALAAAQPAAPFQIGVTAPALQTSVGNPATFDLGGFRLGMSEADVEAVMKARGMKVQRAMRVTTFEDNVRGLVNVRGGQLAMRGGSVLGEADLNDGKGGRVMLRFLAWPDGARVRSIAYLPPAGTDPTGWRSLLTGKYGPAASDSVSVDSNELHARWCGRARCVGVFGAFALSADVGPDGGVIALSQPDGTGDRLKVLVEAEAARRGPRGTPAL